MAKKERMKTGIPGFDVIIQGGFIPNSVNLINGGPGTGKSIFCMQFLWNGLKKGESCVYISFDASINKLQGDAMALGWDFSDYEKSKKVEFVRLDPYTSPDILVDVRKILEKNKPDRVVIDSLSVIAMSLKDPYLVRKMLYSLLEILENTDTTTLATSEIHSSPDVSDERSPKKEGVEEFVVDAIITCYNAGLGGKSDRAIRIVKMRRTDHVKGPVPMEITGKGVRVLDKDSVF